MLTTKVFFRKTKGGNIYKTVREHYLRDDIWCGSKICKSNSNHCKQKNRECILDDEDSSAKSALFSSSYYLLLDTNIILDQIDILSENALYNVIILQTVLEEVRHKSPTIYKRLKEIIGDVKRRFYIFVNEHHKDTYVERVPGENINDRNDRAIRVATNWYNKHLNVDGQKILIVLLTDDLDNKKKAEEENIPVFSMEEYVKSLENSSLLLDKLSKRNFILETEGQEIFPCHLPPSELHNGIKNGKFFQGTFSASKENFLEGCVNVDGIEKSILVQGRMGLNRAIDGDIVAIELLPEDQWSTPSEIVLQDEDETDIIGDILDDEKELNNSNNVKETERTPTGKIVGIIRRKWRQYCGILQPNIIQGNVIHLFVPAERKIPKVRVETRQYELLSKQRIIVAIDSWPRNSKYPLGHFIRALGNVGDKETENEVLLLEHDVPHSRFSDAVLSFLPKMPWTISENVIAEREDLRHLDICSVDPPGCTDIDDALHCRLLPNGNYEVGVHIADVSHFIKPGTALDKEAALRGTTVYLVDKRISMIPELLSNNLCSLKENEDRLTFSCIWEMDSDSNIISTRFCKSVIRSRRAMTYEEAQIKIDDVNQKDVIAESLRNLNDFAKKMKKRRTDNGALTLASPDIYLQEDNETHEPIDVQVKKLRDTNFMIEEFMLLANISVAEKIISEFPECAMLRRHPEPPQKNFEPLIKAGKNQGFVINTNSGKELAESLDKAQKEDNPYFNTMLRILTTRCLMQAVYFISGMHQQNEFYHYGLATPIYTHFTSPIRRYADIIVHRLLAISIGADVTYSEIMDKHQNQKLCYNLNYRNRMAQYAGRASIALNIHLFFREKVKDEEGYILFVRKNALQVLIPRYGLEGTLYLNKTDASVTFTYNREDHSQSYKNIIFRTFDLIVVQLSLDRSNVQHEKLIFQLVKPEIPGFSVPPITQHPAEQSVPNMELNVVNTIEKRKSDKILTESSNINKRKHKRRKKN